MIRFAVFTMLLFLGMAPDHPPVEAELLTKEKVRGTLKLDAIKLDSEFGSFTILPSKLRELTIGHLETLKAPDVVDLSGLGHFLHGRLTTTEFPIETADGLRTISRSELRKITVTQPGSTSILGGIIIPLVTLTAMEIVLGIDNIIFIAIVAGKLPRAQQPRARRLGLGAALVTRLLLLATLSTLLGLTSPVFTLPDLPFFHDLEAREISWRDIILLVGGMFLIGKSTYEIHEKLDHSSTDEHGQVAVKAAANFGWTLVQIAIIDIVFSLDSVITAVGMVQNLWIMITAMVVAVGIMMLFAEYISKFVERNPTLKILALSFLILIGVMLVAEGCGQHIEKGYIYFAMAFAVGVEVVNLRLRRKSTPVMLANSQLPPEVMA